MTLSPLYLATIRRVHVEFDLTALDLDPDEVSLAIKIKPSRSARRGDERRNPKGTVRHFSPRVLVRCISNNCKLWFSHK